LNSMVLFITKVVADLHCKKEGETMHKFHILHVGEKVCKQFLKMPSNDFPGDHDPICGLNYGNASFLYI